MKKRRGFGHVIMLISIIAIGISSTTIANYYKVQNLKALVDFKKEGDSFALSELNNITTLCSEERTDYEYFKISNYNRESRFTLSCTILPGPVVDFDMEACRPKDMDSLDLICKDYSGQITY